jgi:hypothetical protein
MKKHMQEDLKEINGRWENEKDIQERRNRSSYRI